MPLNQRDSSIERKHTHQMKTHLGPYLIETTRNPGSHLSKSPHNWETNVTIPDPNPDPDPDPDTPHEDTTPHCYSDHCSGSPEQAEAMHQEMLETVRSEIAQNQPRSH